MLRNLGKHPLLYSCAHSLGSKEMRTSAALQIASTHTLRGELYISSKDIEGVNVFTRLSFEVYFRRYNTENCVPQPKFTVHHAFGESGADAHVGC